MSKDYATEITLAALEQNNPAKNNPAVAHCCKAWKKVYRASLENHQYAPRASDEAAEAFRAALPPLISHEGCRDFIACVAFGVLIHAIPEKQSGKLVYAAQTVLSTLPPEAKTAARRRRGSAATIS